MLPHGPALSQEIPAQALPLFDRIWAGHPLKQECAYYLEYLTFHLPPQRLVPALQLLIREKLVGERFVQFVLEDCARSGLELMKFITMRLDRDKKIRPLFRKDFA